MDYTPHRCSPARFDCTGGGDNPHVCEVDSVHQGACNVCAQYPTDPKILRQVMFEHHRYAKDPYAEKTINYRDKSQMPKGCDCSPFELFTKGHRKGCSKC